MSHTPHNIGMTLIAGNGKAAIRLTATCPAGWVGTTNVREDAPR